MFLQLFFAFFKILHKSLMVFYKVRHVYSAIHKFPSTSHQLVKIFIIINHFFFFIPHSIYIQSSNWPGKSFPRTFLSRLNIFAAVDIQSPNNILFFRLMFSTSFIDFKKVFKESDIASNVNWSS